MVPTEFFVRVFATDTLYLNANLDILRPVQGQLSIQEGTFSPITPDFLQCDVPDSQWYERLPTTAILISEVFQHRHDVLCGNLSFKLNLLLNLVIMSKPLNPAGCRVVGGRPRHPNFLSVDNTPGSRHNPAHHENMSELNVDLEDQRLG